jgi:DNA helicase-2/ATP-dependent DNA helicase PcrA
VLARHNHVTGSCRGLFYRGLPLWEGHTRPALDKLVDAIIGESDPARLAHAACEFVGKTCKGFTPSGFGNQLVSEAGTDCTAAKKGKSIHIQALARHIVERPDHRGVADMLRALHALMGAETAFADVELDHRSEYWDAIRLGTFDDIEAGLAEISNRRTYSRPKPAAKSISTIHKAKGLECDDVVLLSLDARSFPDKMDARCLLYVALSRAKKRLLIVASKTDASPLVII